MVGPLEEKGAISPFKSVAPMDKALLQSPGTPGPRFFLCSFPTETTTTIPRSSTAVSRTTSSAEEPSLSL